MSMSVPCLKPRLTYAPPEVHEELIESKPRTVLNSSSSGNASFSITSWGTAAFHGTRTESELPSNPLGKSSSLSLFVAIRPTMIIVRNRTNIVTLRLRDNRVIWVASLLDSIYFNTWPAGESELAGVALGEPSKTVAKIFRNAF